MNEPLAEDRETCHSLPIKLNIIRTAVKQGEYWTVYNLISDPGVNKEINHLQEILFASVRMGEIDKIKLLISDPLISDDVANRALTIAAEEGNLELMRTLLSRKHSYNYDILTKAAVAGEADLIKQNFSYTHWDLQPASNFTEPSVNK